MKFPEVLTVIVLDQSTRAPVAGIALVIELFTSRKNNYVVGPVISDQYGKAIFTKAECERAISVAQNMFPMDYVGNLEDCDKSCEIRLHAPEHIETMVRQYRSSPSFWGQAFENPDKIFIEVARAINRQFEPACALLNESNLAKNSELCLYIERRGGER